MSTTSLLSNLLASETGFDTSLDCVLGRNAAVRKIARHAECAAEAECTVLVSGETGTGKEIWAKLLHRCGPRATSHLFQSTARH